MPRIRFTTSPKLPRDLMHLGYAQGTEVDLSEDQANRWLRRGVAEIIADKVAPVRPTEAPAPPPVVAQSQPAAIPPAPAAPLRGSKAGA